MAPKSKDPNSIREDWKKSSMSISMDEEHRKRIHAMMHEKGLKTFSSAIIYAIDRASENNHGHDLANQLKKSLSIIRETNISHVALDVKELIERTIFPNRKIRVGFAQKMSDTRGSILKYNHIAPIAATYPIFHYPCTIASWALIEGRIFAYPRDRDRKCDFDRVGKLIKSDIVARMFSELEDSLDDVSKRYINAQIVKDKFCERTLSLADIYQDWVGDQPSMDYCQFVSVPVPIVENVYDHRSPPEYGVINIDTSEAAPLLTRETEPLLALASEIMAVAFRFLDA